MRNIAIALAAVAAIACGTSKQAKRPVTVSDSDYGRLQAGQTQLVDQARADLARARDEVARARLRRTEAGHEDDLARADLTGADAARTRYEAQAKMAKESNDPAQIERARETKEQADLRKRAAQARMEYAQKLIATRDVELKAAEQRVRYEEARVEQAKLQALQVAKVPAAEKYDQAALDARVTGARADLDRAEAAMRKAGSEAANAQRLYLELDRQLQARAQAAAPRG